MKFLCFKDKLYQGINTVQKAVADKSSMPILECILIVCEDDGIYLMSNNLEMGIKTSLISCEVIEKGSYAVSAKMFSEIIRKLPDGDVSFSITNKNVAVISCINTEFKILCYEGENFPELPNVEKSDYFKIPQKTLKDMIKNTLFSISNDDTKPVFKGELFDISESNLNVVSVDGFRISLRKAEIKNSANIEKVIIPGSSLNEISKILNDSTDEISVYLTNRHALFDLGHCIIVTRLIEGEFLNYNLNFTDEYELKIKIRANDFYMSLERASLLSSSDINKKPVNLKMEEQKLKITSNTENGAVYDEISVEKDGSEINIAFNPKYLIDAVRTISDEYIYINFKTAYEPCIIHPIEGDSYKYLILPVSMV